MVIDIDFSEDKIKNLQEVVNLCEEKHRSTGDSYILYLTNNGVHVFVSNKKYDHRLKETIDYMIDFGVDFNYAAMTYVVGWCIRLNKKHKDDNMYTYVCDIGNDFSRRCLVDLHIDYSTKYEDTMIDQSIIRK
jgi:hypothetical protein